MMFSVIIPVYNAEKYLRPCLDSVLNQSDPDWECICVDDGSSDLSGQILDEYAGRDSRFKVIHQANQGVGAARNLGLTVARGDWITWLDADDVYRFDRLSESRKLIDFEHPDLVRFRTYMAHRDEDQIPVDFHYVREYVVLSGCNAQKWGWQILAPAGMVWTWVARRELVQDLLFPLNMRTKEDSIFCGRMANRLQKVVQSEYVAYFYRWIDSSAMHSTRRADDCICLLKAVLELFQSPACIVEGLDADVRQEMVCWLRVHAESDIIDWVRMRLGERARSGEILSCYRELKQIGVCDCPSRLPRRLVFPFWWWSHTGQMWPIDFVDCILSIVRGFLWWK